MKTYSEAWLIATKWEEDDFIGPGALVARALLAHINSLASPQVTDEQIVKLTRVIDCLEILNERPRPMCRDCADECGVCPHSGLDCDMRGLIASGRALLSAPPAADHVRDATEMVAATPEEAKPVAAKAYLVTSEGIRYWTAVRELRTAEEIQEDHRDAGIMDTIITPLAAAPQEQAPVFASEAPSEIWLLIGDNGVIDFTDRWDVAKHHPNAFSYRREQAPADKAALSMMLADQAALRIAEKWLAGDEQVPGVGVGSNISVGGWLLALIQTALQSQPQQVTDD